MPPGRKLLFALLAAALALGALEGLARVVEALLPPARSSPDPAPGPVEGVDRRLPGLARPVQSSLPLPPLDLTQDPGRGWSLRPNQVALDAGIVVRINALGLRGDDLPAAREPGERRLLTLGDSSVFGFGVAEGQILGDVSAAALSRPGRPVRGANGGMPGYTADQSLQVLDRVGPALRPDWVVIANLWSDLYAAYHPVPTAGRPRRPLASYRLAVRVLAPLLPAPRIGWLDLRGGGGTPAGVRQARAAIPAYSEALRVLGARAIVLGARPVFLVLPAPVDLDPSGAPAYVEAYRGAMTGVASALHAPVVDGPAEFRAKKATNIHFLDQVHPSPAGHALLGLAVARTLEASPGSPP